MARFDAARNALKAFADKLTVRQRQWAMAAGLLVGLIGFVWLVFSLGEGAPKPMAAKPPGAEAAKVTNVMPSGAQVKPLDEWVGNAGKKLDQYEKDKESQAKLNKDNEDFQKQIQARFLALEQQNRGLAAGAAAGPQTTSAAAPAPAPAVPPAPTPPAFPPGLPGATPAAKLPPPPPAPMRTAGMPEGTPGIAPDLAAPPLTRVALRETKPAGAPAAGDSGKGAKNAEAAKTLDTFLPVSFTRGVMLGGVDAPTGGQAQSNPHPVLIRLEDNAILPNQFRSNVRECFVIAAAYGDIASERAYLRAERLSCVRTDGSAMEVKITAAVYGEDGKVGVRGRLVTKQGQMLANALLAGVVSGIGQGITNYGTTTTTSTFGQIATTDSSQAFRAGVGNGVGKALDRLANYYIKLAENTFPIIEVDAGRAVDVVLTEGVRIEGGDPAGARAAANDNAGDDGQGGLSKVRDEDY